MQFFYKFIYNSHINYILRNILKVFNRIFKLVELPPSGTLSINLESNKNFKLSTNQTNYVTKLLFWNGHKNFEYLELFEQLIPKINVFYDVGANIGLYSIVAEVVNNTVQTRSFEPSNGPFHYLEKNVRLNRLSNTKIEKLALANTRGQIKFYEVKNPKYTYIKHNLAGEGNFGAKESNKIFDTILVESNTLDSYANKEGHTIDLIKIDTEGTEHLILQGASKVLNSMRPIVICETLFNTIENELENIFKPINYKFYNHTSVGLIEVDTIKRTIDDGVRNCFFVPKEKVLLIEEFVTK